MTAPAATGFMVRGLGPGLALSAAVAVAAVLTAPLMARIFPIPAMVIALIIGIAFSGLAEREAFRAGIAFSVRTLLRWAVALLGLRISLGEIIDLGLSTGLLIVVAMIATLVSGFLFARWLGQEGAYGALAGAGTAVCGASATLATSTVIPDYKGKAADVAFVVVAVNTLSTFAMVLYPPLCALLGLDSQATGVMLGATIHDVAQVVGAGYAVSEPVGNTAVIVKLFRVFLLLPVVIGVGLWFSRAAHSANVPIPVFAFVFLALCLINSLMPSLPILMPFYEAAKPILVELSTWGLLTAIGALGLSTSLRAIGGLGWRHVATVIGTTAVILVVVSAGLLVMR
jgi:uncharacterized integral membrane protein (TIGR00698 family)